MAGESSGRVSKERKPVKSKKGGRKSKRISKEKLKGGNAMGSPSESMTERGSAASLTRLKLIN